MAARIPLDESLWNEYLTGQEAQLPPLPDTHQMTSRVIRILAGNPGTMRLQGTNTYLVGTGRSRILIDTGEGLPVWSSRISHLLAAQNLDLAHILLTHWHGDHTGGVADLLRHHPHLAPRVHKAQPDAGQRPITDGQVFAVEGATLRAVFAPGHAIDHMCFLLDEENALFTGDNVLGHGFSVVMDLAVYMRSLDRMASLACAVGYPAHGAGITHLPGRMAEYIRHNEFRVRQVFSALSPTNPCEGEAGKTKTLRGRGGMTIYEIIRSIYGNVPAEIVEQALVPFMTQVLWKLAEDKMVGFSPGEQRKRTWFVLGGLGPGLRPGVGLFVPRSTSVAASVLSASD